MKGLTGAARVAGVCGNPVAQSLSPLIHNAWIAAAGLDAAYAPFAVSVDRFERFIDGLRGGGVRGLNITIPFKERALAAADDASPRAKAAGAANLLAFEADGRIIADNTDGEGLLAALASQTGFSPSDGPVVLLGAGGAARGAAAALRQAGCPDVRVVNRSYARAAALADDLGCAAFSWDQAAALDGAAAVVNATSLGLGGGAGPDIAWAVLAPQAVVMDMVYKPLRTGFLTQAARRGHRTADGLAMLIGQARPSFRTLFGAEPPTNVDVRKLALSVLEPAA